MLSDLNRDPWRLGYKIALEKLFPGGTSPLSLLNTSEADAICEELFPRALNETEDLKKAEEQLVGYEGLSLTDVDHATDTTGYREVEMHELSVAIKRMCRRRKAPGLDGVFGVILRNVFAIAPQWIMSMINIVL